MTKKVLVDLNVTGKVTANKGLELPSTTAPVTLNGQNGTSGDVLTSAGSGTPTWTTPVTSGTKTANTFLAGPVFGGGGATFRPIDYRDIYPATPPTNYGQVIQYAPVGNGMAWTSAAPLLVTGGSVSGALNLSSTTAPLQVQGSAGTLGQVLTSAGTGASPTWSSVKGYKLIAFNEFAGTIPAFTSIPQTYKKLVVQLIFGSIGTLSGTVSITANSNSSCASTAYLVGTTTATVSTGATTGVPLTNGTPLANTKITVEMPNYNGSYPMMYFSGGNNTGAQSRWGVGSTASAITQISFRAATTWGNALGAAYLYGVE